MGFARCRLACLWISQTARVLADWCLRVFVVLSLAGAGEAQKHDAWHLVTALTMLPFVLLAPCNGAISNSLPKPWVLAGSAGFCLAVVGVFALLDGPWLAGWVLLAIGSAIYSPTRYAFLPAAARDTQIPLTRINGLIEMGAFVSVVAGIFLGLHYYEVEWWQTSAAVVLAVTFNLVGLVAALPVRFASDVYRPEPPGRALVDFFRDGRRILADREARSCLLGLASLRAVVTGMTGAIVAITMTEDRFSVHELLPILAWVLGGVAAGSLLAALQRHPRRVLGLVPTGATGLTFGLVLASLGHVPGPVLCVFLGIMAGLVNVPMAATYQAALPADARGNGMAVRNFADYIGMAGVSFLLVLLTRGFGWSGNAQLGLMAGLAALLTLLAWRTFFRDTMEYFVEVVAWPLFRIRGHGPGLVDFPQHGPLIILANHSAWFDPIWLAKVLPCRIIPMMTSVFYDLPVMRWLMVNVARAIRVEASTFRREVPEIELAIDVLDRGHCLVIFPEGGMRRSEDRPLKQFGQGVWHILKERPHTPVVVCWIEGGWGSYFSYYNGLPTKNKRMDYLRKIDIAVAPPQVLDARVLADHRTTRNYLMKECLQARRFLGLEPWPLPNLQSKEEEE